MPLFSIVIPVYNRADELSELLETIALQTFKDFEVVVVEDGSNEPCKHVIDRFRERFVIQYIVQSNQGPGPARNTGAEQARGRWLIFLDSDCMLPPSYLEIVNKETCSEDFDCFGGPDKAHPSFNIKQKAIGHAMSSLLTTGGIRGATESLDVFYPRSYNLGVRKSVLKALGGFSKMRFGEDLDFSMRLMKKGYSTRLLKDGFVFHKRRSTFYSFFKQVYNSGIARINLEIRHKGTLKPVHMFPALFVLGHLAILSLIPFFPWLATLLFIVPIILFIDAAKTTHELKTSLWVIPATYTQVFGYGLGFMEGFIVRKILKREEFHAFGTNFYK